MISIEKLHELQMQAFHYRSEFGLAGIRNPEIREAERLIKAIESKEEASVEEIDKSIEDMKKAIDNC